MMQTIAESGAGMSGASAVHMNIFSLNPVVVFASDAQKKRWLPPLIAGEDRACFGVTEPNTGLDTTHLKTQAVRDGDGYVVSGRKIWTSTAQVSNKILLLARTTPLDQVAKATQGLTLFYTDLDRNARRSARNRENGPQGRRLEPAFHRRPARAGGRPRGRGRPRLRIHPARVQSRAHPRRSRSRRSRPRGARGAQPSTRKRASCSAGRSGRTRRSSIRSRNAGWSSRPRT